MNMPPPVLPEHYSMPESDPSAMNGPALAHYPLAAQTYAEMPLVSVASASQSANALTRALQEHPQLCLGLMLAFGVALLLAGGWTLYGSALKRTRTPP